MGTIKLQNIRINIHVDFKKIKVPTTLDRTGHDLGCCI